MRSASMQVFESHATPEEAEAAHRNWKGFAVDLAEIRPPFGRPIRLPLAMSKGVAV
jgi:hypothetical protein